MRGRWCVGALCAAILCLGAVSATASANAGFQRCQASSKALGLGFYAPATCTTTWTCKGALPCYWQPYVKTYGMFFQHQGGSFTGQAYFAGKWPASAALPFTATETCTATAATGSTATCSAYGPEKLVAPTTKVAVTCLAGLVPKRYVGGYAYCGLMWRN